MSVLAVCPSRGRPAAANAVLASFLETRRAPATRLVFLVDEDDPTRYTYPQGYTTLIPPKGSFAGALVQAGRVYGDAKVIGVVGDDNRFATPGWDVTIGDWLTENIGIAHGNDGHEAYHLAGRGFIRPTAWWLSRPIVDKLGLALPALRHYYMDDYWYAMGTEGGCLRYFPEVSIPHLHPDHGDAEMDDTYRRNSRHGRRDKAIFDRWKKNGKQRDLARLRSALKTGERQRVFADWHHPALWESLRLLFEERFGWELYSPIGREWLRRGWQFWHEDWKQTDYLMFPDAKPVNSHYQRNEAEYPDHPRKLLTVAQADAMRPDIVIATVAAHRETFRKLAEQWGARFVYQVGNANQPLMDGADVLILASAALRRKPRQVVTYHQEFDLSTFSPSPITEPDRVTSYMMRMDSASCEYRWMSNAKGVRWASFGGVDPNAKGYLAPMSRVADEMRRSGWIWHDKRISDGYGHVLHNAAAMGRPLIGHASHYARRLGEPFWQDLRTCIDLDKHQPDEALRLFHAINADKDWHAEMSANIQAEFTSHVDFAAEAEQIKAALA